MSNLTFTGQQYLVTYSISRHLMGRRDIRLNDDEDDALCRFLDSIDTETGGRDRWVLMTADSDGMEDGTCMVTGRRSGSLVRVALISWSAG